MAKATKDMSNSVEYNSMLDCVPELRQCAKTNIVWLSGHLQAARLINDDKEVSLRNTTVNEVDRAAELISLVLNKVKEHSENYHLFVEILSKNKAHFKSVLDLLKEKFRSRSESLNGSEYVKSKPKTAVRSVMESSCQTCPSALNGSNSQHLQSHHAFGATCGCKICSSELGCPQPITAEATFPLLDDMDGLDKLQKEDLRVRLKRETRQIMIQFYHLLTDFCKSLTNRNVSVEDIKMELMVLEAFDDDDEHCLVFHEQMGKLKRASTIDQVLEVIKVFCSFVNYELIECLITRVGTDEDIARLEKYKEAFTDYARRRIYQCSQKTAMTASGQCDMYVKLESRYSQKLSLNDLREFRANVSDLLKISLFCLRLCCIEKGCIRLTFQIPSFVKQRVFPLTSEQEGHLIQLGAIQLICGDYEFTAKDKPGIPPTAASNTHSRENAKSCLDCTSSSGEITLKCKKHFLCNDCLVKRTQTIQHSEELLACTCDQVTHTSESKPNDDPYAYRNALLSEQHTCKEVKMEAAERHPWPISQPAPTSTCGVWIFVNDSNIWIEAKKLQGKHKMFKTSEDHRVRMDMGKLADVLAKGRPIRRGRLYGSEPPKIDTVWERIRKQGWDVVKVPKTPKRGKEKQMSTQFVVDIVSLAEKTPPEERSTIILVSGDADIIPAIEKVIEVDGWNVEVYMWSHATSKQLQKLQSKHNGQVTVSSLDPYYGDVVFTNMKFSYSNENILETVKKSSVVFTVNDDSTSFPNHIPTDQWMFKLEEIAQWPCQYCWYNHPVSGRTNKLVVVFKEDSKAGPFEIDKFLEKVISEDKCRIPSVVRVQPFLDFVATDNLDRLGGDFEQIGRFNQHDAHSGFQSDSVYVTDTLTRCSSDAQIRKWNTHLNRPPIHVH